MRIEDKTVRIKASTKDIYEFLRDLSGFGKLLPKEVENWQIHGDECSFSIRNIGRFNIRRAETKANSKVQYVSIDSKPFYYDLDAQIREVEDNVSEVQLIFNTKMNAMMRMIAAKPLRRLLEKMSLRLKDVMENTH